MAVNLLDILSVPRPFTLESVEPSVTDTVFGHSVHKIIQKLLIDLEVATDPNDQQSWPVFAPIEADKPDNCLVVQRTTGVEVGSHLYDGAVTKHYGFQLLIRCLDPDEAEVKAELLYQTLNKIVNCNVVSLGDNLYCVNTINTSGDIISMGMRRPANRLHLYSINALADIHKLS